MCPVASVLPHDLHHVQVTFGREVVGDGVAGADGKAAVADALFDHIRRKFFRFVRLFCAVRPAAAVFFQKNAVLRGFGPSFLCGCVKTLLLFIPAVL